MLQRFNRYAAALLVLSLACAVYQFTFVAWLEPDPLEPVEFAQSLGLQRSETLASLFPADAWQLQHCKRLQTRDGVLLFEHWQQIGDDQWKLWPLTLVMGLNSDSPLILETDEGAEIKFSESLDMMSGGAPPIERGRMMGQVRIRSVGESLSLGDSAGDPSNASAGHLEIISSDFGIDHRKIWTTQPIEVRLGEMRLAGRDLTLHLAPIGRIEPGGEGALSILDRLELIYLDELVVPLPEGGLWQTAGDQAAADTATADQVDAEQAGTPAEDAPAEGEAIASLRLAGRVVFLFGTHELTLTDRVRLEHRTARATDLFECELLKLQFANLLHRRTVAAAAQREEEVGDYLLRVIAEGRPAQMRLPSFSAEVAAERIDLDTRGGLLRMSGRAGARISYAGHTWRFNQFTYRLNPNDPAQIGAFDALGSGLVEFSGDTELPVKRLRWTDGIKLDQPEAGGEFSLRVDGNVTALMNDGGEFTCDSARLVLQAGSRELAGEDWLEATRPTRFQATGHVAMRSPMVDIATRLLQIYFAFDEPAAAAAAKEGAAENDAHPLRQWVRQPTAPEKEQSKTPKIGSATPLASQRPMLHGDTINARLRLRDTELTATDLSVLGNVSVRHSLDTPSGPLLAVLTGDRLQLRDTAGDEVLQIGSGLDSPAKLALGDGYFIGPLIQVRMADNIVWIKDAGEFQVPSQLLTTPQSAGRAEPVAEDPATQLTSGGKRLQVDSNNLRWISPPRCRWRGQMLFDGSRAVLTEGVDLRGVVMVGAEQDVWDVDLVGDQLEVVLDQTVQMRQLDTVRAATVERVSVTASAANPLVVTANQLTARGVRKARHVLTPAELTFRPSTAVLTGAGPGWYRAWIQTADAPLGAAVTSGGFRAAESSLVGAHLIYEDRLEANLNAQSLDFHRGVRIATRSVAAWDDLVDVHAMQGLRMGESTLDCDRLRLGIDQTLPPGFLGDTWEMEATGGVLFQTRNDRGLFSGNADRAAYTAAKETFLIQGEPGRSATMNQTLPTGAAGMNVAVKRMSVNTRTMEVQNVEFERLQVGNQPGMLPNLAR